MKFAIESLQQQFFRKHRFLETEGLLGELEVKEFNQHLEKALAEKLKINSQSTLYHSLPHEIFKESRDLSRFDSFVKKMALHKRFAEIASELIEFRPLRFGYDELYMNCKENKWGNPYKDLMVTPRNLKEIASIQGVLCGAMICLKNEEEEAALKDTSIFPKKPGNVTFFSGDTLIDFNALVANCNKRYFLIVYTHPTAIYYLEEKDPKGYHLKTLGYVFGDRLNDKLNPIVYR